MNLHIVNFHDYCKKCKYQFLAGHEEPCNECLTEGMREDSRIPVNFEEATQKNNSH